MAAAYKLWNFYSSKNSREAWTWNWGRKTKKDYTAIILQQTSVYAWETLSYTEGMC